MFNCFANQYRSCYLKEALNKINQKIKVSGFVANKRDHGGIVFIDLRDHTGILQIVCDHNQNIDDIPLESVISVEGIVKQRETEQINANLITGSIELISQAIQIISKSNLLPIEVNNNMISEDLKLKYRTVYLRGEKMHRNLQLRAELIQLIRQYMITNDFLEVQTPLITTSSPEGARDFVIPSRLHPGKFYALPQAPQMFKQLLMASGFNRYFQVAPCFRDEDARRDRCYGEFYQLDVEMSFVEQENVLAVLADVTKQIIHRFTGKNAQLSRLTYHESLEKYGTDKPDLRNPLYIEDFSELFKNSEMDLFKNQILQGKFVKGIRIANNFGNTPINNSICKNILEQIEKDYKFKIAYIIKQDNEIKGPIAKFIQENYISNGEAIFFVCDSKGECEKKLDILRNYLPRALNFQLDPMNFQLVEIVDFPMFEADDRSPTGWSFTHNPFSKPKNFNDDLSTIKADQYDLVLNGIEICSGSIRNTDVDLLIKCFEKTGNTEVEVREKFNSMITGFSYGVVPHGGFAIGIDRMLMILLNEENVREVVAFPLNTNGYDPFTKTPGDITEKQKKELFIESTKKLLKNTEIA